MEYRSKISQLNAKFDKQLGGVDSADVRKKRGRAEALLAYRKKMEEKVSFSINFANISQDGTFSFLDEDGVLILLETQKEDVIIDMPMRFNLDIAFDVKVVRVDDENGRVYVESTRAQGQKPSQSAMLAGELRSEVNAGRRPCVYGKVKSVSADGKKAVVSIFGLNVIGFINVANWKKDFTRNLHHVCKVDDYYKFEVASVATKYYNKNTAFILDRRNVAEDPWKSEAMQGLREGDALLVKCLEKPVDKTYWWGRSTRVPDIEIMGDFSENFTSYDGIIEGFTYECIIKKLVIAKEPGEKNWFKVKAYKVCAEDAPALQALRTKISLEQEKERGLLLNTTRKMADVMSVNEVSR